jgi:formin-binding protein 1
MYRAQAYIEAQQQLTFFTNSECILRVEIETISAALGGELRPPMAYDER